MGNIQHEGDVPAEPRPRWARESPWGQPPVAIEQWEKALAMFGSNPELLVGDYAALRSLVGEMRYWWEQYDQRDQQSDTLEKQGQAARERIARWRAARESQAEDHQDLEVRLRAAEFALDDVRRILSGAPAETILG